MSRPLVRRLAAAVVVLALAVRALAWRFGPALYPDALFQYVEPAWRHVAGVGMQTWEWRDGLRSWVLPGYHGGWLALLHAVRLPGSWIGRFLALHWAIVSLAMLWAAFRSGAWIGRRLARRSLQGPPADGAASGLLAALLVATFPLLGVYSLEPLSELPSMIAFVAGMAFVATALEGTPREARNATLAAGTLFSFAACVRDANAPLVLVPVVWLVVGRRGRFLERVRLLAWLTLAAIGPVLLFGIVDACTWGGFLSSILHHLRFNVVEHGAEGFGREPMFGYLQRITNRLPVGIWVLLVPALVGVRATWPFLGTAVALVALATSQPHKEERFVILAYPLLLIAAGGVAGRWLERGAAVRAGAAGQVPTWVRTAWGVTRRALVALGVVAVVADGAMHVAKFDYDIPRARFFAEAWAGAQPDATGLLIDWPYYAGGYLWFGRTVPALKYERELLDNHLFTHVLLRKDDGALGTVTAAGFAIAYDRDGVVVLRRKR